jgi:Pyruvate/2-oxoacid:ferredoxin oxidoreductase gamma subunit
MSQPAFDKFSTAVYPGGYIFYNSDIVQVAPTVKKELEQADIKLVAVNASTLAEEAGLSNSANVVILGRLLAMLPYFSAEDVFSLLADKFKTKVSLVDLNKKAFTLGANAQ